MNKMHRAQILLEPAQHQKLTEIAQREGTSISDLVRLAVNNLLKERRRDDVLHQRLQALEQIEQHHQMILARRHGAPLELDIPTILNQIRDERDDELFAYTFKGS